MKTPHLTSPKLIANSFKRQLNTSKQGKHSSSRRALRVSKEESESFTSDQVTSAIKSCRNSRAYGPDSLSIFHLKNIGPLATEHFTALSNDSLKSCRLPSMWKTSISIPIPKSAKTHRMAHLTDPPRCYAQRPRSSRRSSYPLLNNFSHQLKINTASDPATRLHLPFSSSQRTSRQVSTSGNHLTTPYVGPST